MVNAFPAMTQSRTLLMCFQLFCVASSFSSPTITKRSDSPNREERFQIKNAEFQSIGCWSDSIDERALLPLEGKHPLLMDGKGGFRANALMKCAEAAWDMGLKLFALQNGGECMGEDDGDRKYMKQGMSTMCHGDGLGGPYANEVYRFLGSTVQAKDGMYADWQPWGGCSTTCGQGTMTRIRTCTAPVPYGGGNDCTHFGPAMESRKCNMGAC